jgi:signal transduction histidine kinase
LLPVFAMDEQELRLRERIASHFEDNADAITDAWLEILRRRLRLQLVQLLPTEELRDHIPLVIASVGTSLRLLGRNPAEEVIAHLRVLSELRRDQSYAVVEVLAELQALAGLLFAEVVDIVERGDWDGATVVAVCAGLHRRLDGLGSIAVETYQEAYLREKQQLAERLSDLASTLEHELRTPLQAAVSGLDMLGEESIKDDPARRQHYTGYVRERLQKISHLLSDVRELATAERVMTHENRRPIREVIRAVLDEVERFAHVVGVQVIVVDPIEDILVDPARIEVALVNLVSNAIKYSDPDKAERWVEISLRMVPNTDPPRWQLRVEDNGLGIPRGFERKIFGRKIRIHPERAAGTGLGLAIVKEMAEQRGGTIGVETEEGRGSTFILEMTHHLAEPVEVRVRPYNPDVPNGIGVTSEAGDEPDEPEPD